MGRNRNSDPPQAPVPRSAIDHLFDGDADPARPLGDDRPDVDVDLTFPEDGAAEE